jgi:hypothetical protein
MSQVSGSGRGNRLDRQRPKTGRLIEIDTDKGAGAIVAADKGQHCLGKCHLQQIMGSFRSLPTKERYPAGGKDRRFEDEISFYPNTEQDEHDETKGNL